MKETAATKQLLKTFVFQHDSSDCGAACLLSVIRYYGGNNTFENIRKLSGTSATGTTLLGMYQAATQLSFDTEGCEGSVDTLIKHGAPCILFVNNNHYVLCYGVLEKENGHLFAIGDPAKGITYWNQPQLEEAWQTNKCLQLLPNASFKRETAIKHEKRKWIIKLIKADVTLLSIAAAIGIGIALLGLAMAVFSQKLIDEILPKREFEKLYLGVILVLLLLIAKEFFSFLRQTILLRQGKDFNIRIVKHFYTRLLQLHKPFFDTHKIGELTARLNDTGRIQKVISQIAGNAIIDILTTLVTTCFLFIYYWKVALACICFLPLYYFLIRTRNKKLMESQRNVMATYAATESNYISTLQGIETIKNFQKQSLFEGTNNTVYKNYQDKILALGKIQINLSFVANLFSIVFLVSVLTFCSYNVLHKEMTAGELMAVLGMSSSLLPSITNLALLSISISEAKIAFDRMYEFTNIHIELTGEDVDQEPLFLSSLQISNLCFRFAGRRQLLRNISFKVSRGEIIAVVGENGCGKSTLTQILQRHYLKESGEIIFNECQLIESIPLKSWRHISGCVSQQTHVFNTTVLENIAFEDATENPNKVLQFLSDYGFALFINSLPQSYMTLVGEGGINLSGGQRQMLAIARALYHRPQLLILDEATASMDRESEKLVINLLLRLKHRMAIIFITHKLHILQNFADRIYVLENGSIAATGSHKELLSASGNLYTNYWSDLNN